jgi:hypothetical protein
MKMQTDTAILQHQIEIWIKELPDYISRLEDKIISRQILPTRKIGANIMFDNVTHYDRTGAGAQIMAKGSVPKGSRIDATSVQFQMYQLLDGFLIHEKDIKLDPKLKQRELEIILNNIHRAENILAINGNTLHSITGITGAAAANSNGVATRTAVWTTPASAKYYDDVLSCLNLMDSDFDPRWLVGNRTDLNQLMHLSDDTKQPIWKQIAALFGKTETDPMRSWMVPCGDLTLAAGKVYVIPQDNRAGELVISENPTLRQISLQRGGNFPIEMYEWLNVEIHNNDAFVELTVN